MGRWAQRKRGGGGPSPQTLIQMVSPDKASATAAFILYSDELSADGFTDGDWTSNPSGETSIAVANADVNILVITFTGDITTDTTVTYAGTKIGILTPQTATYA